MCIKTCLLHWEVLTVKYSIPSAECGAAMLIEGVFARGGATSLQKKYGFVPKISLDDGIKMAIEFFKKNSLYKN